MGGAPSSRSCTFLSTAQTWNASTGDHKKKKKKKALRHNVPVPADLRAVRRPPACLGAPVYVISKVENHPLPTADQSPCSARSRTPGPNRRTDWSPRSRCCHAVPPADVGSRLRRPEGFPPGGGSRWKKHLRPPHRSDRGHRRLHALPAATPDATRGRDRARRLTADNVLVSRRDKWVPRILDWDNGHPGDPLRMFGSGSCTQQMDPLGEADAILPSRYPPSRRCLAQ